MEIPSKSVIKSLSLEIIPTSRRNFYLCLLIIYLLIALFSILTSTLDSAYRGTEVDFLWVIHLAFFYISPIVIWLPLIPLIVLLAKRFPIFQSSKWKRHLLIHALLALISAPIIRLLSLMVDFNVKAWLNLIDTSPWKIISEVWFVAFTTTPRAFYTYLLILLAFSFWNYFYKVKIKPSKNIKPKTISTPQKVLMVQNGPKKVILDLNTVYWISVNGNYIQFHTADQVYHRRGTLAAIEANLNAALFFRIHRSTLVNRAAITSWQHWRRGEYLIQLKNEKSITSSRGYRENMLRLIASFEAEYPK